MGSIQMNNLRARLLKYSRETLIIDVLSPIFWVVQIGGILTTLLVTQAAYVMHVEDRLPNIVRQAAGQEYAVFGIIAVYVVIISSLFLHRKIRKAKYRKSDVGEAVFFELNIRLKFGFAAIIILSVCSAILAKFVFDFDFRYKDQIDLFLYLPQIVYLIAIRILFAAMIAYSRSPDNWQNYPLLLAPLQERFPYLRRLFTETSPLLAPLSYNLWLLFFWTFILVTPIGAPMLGFVLGMSFTLSGTEILPDSGSLFDYLFLFYVMMFKFMDYIGFTAFIFVIAGMWAFFIVPYYLYVVIHQLWRLWRSPPQSLQ